MITQLRVLALAIVGMTIFFTAALADIPDWQKMVFGSCATVIIGLYYDERCQNCGFLVWRRKPEKRFDTGGLFGFIIPRTCRRCGHKHR